MFIVLIPTSKVEILVTKNICKSYSKHVALQDISIEVPHGSIFGLLGPNGAGKTTLIRIINQIIAADSGEIFLNGKKLSQQHIEDIGYLPEERGLYKKMRVGEHLLYLGQLKGLEKHDAMKKIRLWFEKLEISGWWNKNIEDLSKGMQQKIQFIATVLHEPSFLILDEPFSGFDPVNTRLIIDQILDLRNNGSTIIFSTHRMESVEELCDHIALINQSRLILAGSKKNIKETFKSNTYIIEHSNDFGFQDNMVFRLIDKKRLDGNYFRSTVKAINGESPNSLLRAFIDKVEVHSFMEKVPSMNDIFIAKVKEGPIA
jgi:ABC-2 type transport system ATP-binding protein